MPKRAHAGQSSQFDILEEEAQMEEERRTRFYGSARVDLNAMGFDPSPAGQAIESNIQRLLSAFQHAGCLRLHPQYHVPAIIAKGQIDQAIADAASSPEALLDDDAAKWPTLIFPDAFRVQCLHGQHRIEAGKRYLSVNDRWWIVDFYSSDISPRLRARLGQQNLNEQPPNVGEIFFHILNHPPTDTTGMNCWWSQIHSKEEIRQLKRLMKKPALVDAFRKLARFPALGRELLPGNIGRLLTLKCSEEVAHYLSRIYNPWEQVFAGVATATSRLDPHTVATVRSRNVMYCTADHRILEPLVRRGIIFGAFESHERQIIWRNMKNFPGRLPSLHVFFADLNYFEDVTACVKLLFNVPRDQTVYQVLNHSFASYAAADEDHNILRDAARNRSREGRFDIARRRLFLFAMRHLEDMRPESILLKPDSVRDTYGPTIQAHCRLAQEAYRLGFRSEKIAALLSEDPDRAEARCALFRARRPHSFAYDDARLEVLIDIIAGAFDEAQPLTADRGLHAFVTNDEGECVQRRCGRPYQKAFAESAPYMTLEVMHCPQDVGTGGLTSLYVRRDVYLSFFGPLDLHSPGTPGTLGQSAENDTDLAILARDDASVIDNDDSMFISPFLSPSRSADPDLSAQHTQVLASPSGPGEDLDVSGQLVIIRDEFPPAEAIPDQSRVMPRTSQTGQLYAEHNSGGITFICLRGNDRTTVAVIPFDDDAASAIAELVARFVKQGYRPFDSNFRGLAMGQCLSAAREEPEHTLFFIHKDDIKVRSLRVLERQSLKRPAPGELRHPRPRKLHVVE